MFFEKNRGGRIVLMMSSALAVQATFSITVQALPATSLYVSRVLPSAITAKAENSTTLSVPATGVIPVNNVIPSTLVITNTGKNIAYNVYVEIPGTWSAVTQDSSNCTTIPADGGTCALKFSSTSPYLAQNNIQVRGDNITSPPTTALAFSIQGYLVFALSSPSSTDPQVVDTSDISLSEEWANALVPTNAIIPTDGFTNTGTINRTPDIGTSAAVSCYRSKNGGAQAGTWYLPAICQMGGSEQGANCSNGDASTIDHLVQLGFLNLTGPYWSSTEVGTPGAWFEDFISGGSSQGNVFKHYPFGVRCARNLILRAKYQ